MRRQLTYCALAAILVSCSKGKTESVPEEQLKDAAISATDMARLPPQTGNSTSVTLNTSTGEYVTAYGGGINFGTMFIHPLSVPSGQNGQPYSPSFGGFSANNLIGYHINGAHFTMQQGTVVGGMSTNDWEAVHKYYSDFDKFLSGDTSVMFLPDPGTYFSGINTSSNGILTTTGTFIYNNNSPTKVSITHLSVGPPLVPELELE